MNPNIKPKAKSPFQASHQQSNKPEPMDVDRLSLNVNVGSPKRQRSVQHSTSNNNRKIQRVNHAEVAESKQRLKTTFRVNLMMKSTTIQHQMQRMWAS